MPPASANLRRRVRVLLRGIVQGVGFRPFVHNLAAELQLGGWVLNSSAGLITEVEGDPSAVEHFLHALTHHAPPLAWIQESECGELEATGESVFSIRPSAAVTGEFALISPDVATCRECRADISSPSNRRFRYPFTNCTNCGPRYTIIRDIPYDRPHTTMAPFAMCPDCRAEYEDPANRRFHAQPNACPVCGPSLEADCAGDPLEETRRRLAAGEILAVKGLGGFHLACDARNAEAVARLRARKRRSDKPFALMAHDLAAAAQICEIPDAAREALLSTQCPIVILPRRPGAALPEALAPGNRTMGVMLPYTPLHHLLFDGAPYNLLVMTSGNLSEEPIVVSNAEARQRLAGVADGFLFHNRDIYMRTDDSVVRIFEGAPRVMRRSRGYAPLTMDLGRSVPELLAAGGELKNAFCLTKGRHAILSQHIGDMENYETLVFFEETLANLKKLFRVQPRAVAYDLHPLYLSTKYALALPDIPKLGVQHHHAHIAACMAENRIDGQVIGVAFDGSGYGVDGAIWGGEFLVAGYAGFERRAHFRYVPLAGGDAAIRENWRPALAYLMDTFGPEAPFAGVPEDRVRTVRRMIARNIGAVSTSSCGRLFDAVAAIIGLRQSVTFEGQAAIELEMTAAGGVTGSYPFHVGGDGPWELDFRPTIERIVADVQAGVDGAIVSATFHNTIASSAIEVCRRIRQETGLQRVCLTGGTFQNMRLLGTLAPGLRGAGFEVFLHAQVPPNDGGIALGQAAIAAEAMKHGG
ncbi:MAG TPA: carbamoyltransferase HypF [Bryobacteraceae bacterium]|nr:carbamoyltransferase HypF [Bryobacteraceae bacterium]